jgi:hypothetical protein
MILPPCFDAVRRTAVGLLLMTALAVPLHAQCGLTVAESAADEAATGAYVVRATANAPGVGGIGFTYYEAIGNVEYYGLPCDDPMNCSVRLFIGCPAFSNGGFGVWRVSATVHCDAGWQTVGPIDVDAEPAKPSGSLTPFWDQDGIFRVKIKYDFPLGIDEGSAWICVPTTTGQCNGALNGTAHFGLHGSGEYTWRPTVGGKIALHLHGCDDGDPSDTFISQSVTVQPDKTNQNGLQVGGQLTQPQNLPEHKSGETVTARVPLGARFQLWVQNPLQGSTPVSALFDLGTASLQNAQIDPELYPSSAILEFDAAKSATTKTFQAMHLGTQNVVITPDDPSLPHRTVIVQVVPPASLGSTHATITFANASFNLDDQVVAWADRRGIPPQLVKGIMDRESDSKFYPLTWRYEPLTTDWDNFAPAPYGQNQRARSEYAPYRMEYDTAHPRGAWLVDSEDVHPRSVFWIDMAKTGKIGDQQQLVSVYTIYSANDSWQNWYKNLKSVSKKSLLLPSTVATTLSWAANTTLASSYGLMQVLFSESFDNYGYFGIGGRRRPYYLFDTPPNITGGGGSIQVGTGVYVFKYRWENDFNDAGLFSPQYDTVEKLDDDYQNGLMGYNGSFCQASTCYGPDTMTRTQKYLPVPSSALFP